MAMNWLVTGASGLLGRQLCAYLHSQGANVTAIRNSHSVDLTGVTELQVDLLSLPDVAGVIASCRPDVVVHTAGLTNVDECERNYPLAKQLHIDVARLCAKEMAVAGGKFVLISTDHLWDGSRPLVDENEPVQPQNIYGETKAKGELAALEENPEALVVRTNFFGPGRPWRLSFSDWLIRAFMAGETVTAFDDVYFTPIALGHLCPFVQDSVQLDLSGILHLCGGERVSKYQFAVELARNMGFDASFVRRGSVEEANLSAPRPKDMSLNTEKAARLLGGQMPNLSQSLETLCSLPKWSI